MKRLPKKLRREYRLSNNGDAWGRCQWWRFALGDAMGDKGIRPNAFKSSPLVPVYCDEFRFLSHYAVSTLLRFQAYLERLERILKTEGRDY